MKEAQHKTVEEGRESPAIDSRTIVVYCVWQIAV